MFILRSIGFYCKIGAENAEVKGISKSCTRYKSALKKAREVGE
jgi:hypothetical protein